MTHEVPQDDALHGNPSELLPGNGVEIAVSFSQSLASDLGYIISSTGRPLNDIVYDFVTFAMAADSLSVNPEEAIYRDAAGFLQLVHLGSEEYARDVDWQIEGDGDNSAFRIECVAEPEFADLLAAKAEGLGVDIEELYRRMMRMGVTFFYDQEEFGKNHYVKQNGDFIPIDYQQLFTTNQES